MSRFRGSSLVGVALAVATWVMRARKSVAAAVGALEES